VIGLGFEVIRRGNGDKDLHSTHCDSTGKRGLVSQDPHNFLNIVSAYPGVNVKITIFVHIFDLPIIGKLISDFLENRNMLHLSAFLVKNSNFSPKYV
jgi:hypothetical protein